MMPYLKMVRCFVLMLAVTMAFGCATKGPAFSKIATADIPAGKGVVYVYRPSGFVGAAVSYDIWRGNEKLGYLVQGGYFTYLANPGELELTAKTEARASLTLDVRAGQEHYVKGSVGVGAFIGRPKLEVVDAETGSREIQDCKRMQ
jgi:hypothetical protein